MANFDKIATYYDNSFTQAFCGKIHRQTIQFGTAYFKNNSRLLDLGCGPGNFLGRLTKLKKSLELYGVDESEKMIEIAKKKFAHIDFLVARAENLPFPDNNFDVVTAIDTFYYFRAKRKVLSECYRVLNEKGYFLITFPSVDQVLSRWFLELTTRGSIAKGVKYLSFQELTFLAKEAGFQLIKRSLRNYPFLVLCKNWFAIFQKITRPY